MKGNCRHGVWIEDDGSVGLSNDEDSHYCQVFETVEELDEFIRDLVEISLKAFGRKEREK